MNHDDGLKKGWDNDMRMTDSFCDYVKDKSPDNMEDSAEDNSKQFEK
jgi:hypothetical protein